MARTASDTYRLTVDGRGRLVIPANLRGLFGIGRDGAELVAYLDDEGRLVLEDRELLVGRLRGSWGKGKSSATAELLAERRAEAALEDAEAAGDERDIARARDQLARVDAVKRRRR
jgi:bifunctional DNA-binding transcriptional regulator/antitoxin component of YhaV-PrlF toxin-antitoxin module